MILFIDMTHLQFSSEREEDWQRVAHRRLRAKYRFEELSGLPCHIMRYQHFENWYRGRFKIPGVSRLVFSGFNTEFHHYPKSILDAIMDWMRAPSLPTFTICGSFQLMAHAHGAEIAPMGNRDASFSEESVIDPIIPSDMKSEIGYCSIDVHPPSKLFDRECARVTQYQHHYWEVKSVPTGFRHTASSPSCYIQALEHNVLPLTGVQFHPEDYDDVHPDGKMLLLNVFKKR